MMKSLILGAKGMFGSELARQLQEETIALDREELDITNSAEVFNKINEIKPAVIYNCAAYNAVDKAEDEKEKAFAINADAVEHIAKAAESIGAILVHYSTGFVFDGEKDSYTEEDKPNPISVYAQSKYAGEINALNNCSKTYVIRLNQLFGKPGVSEGSKKSFPEMILDLAKEKKEFDFVDDEISTPTYAKDLAAASISLITENKPFGIYHLPNDGKASWYDFAKEIFDTKKMEIKLNKVSADTFKRKATRPKNSVILNTKFTKLRPWQQALREFLS